MSLLMGTPRTATLKTLEATTLFVVDRGNLQSLLRRQQELADRISEELANRQDSLERLGIKIGSQEEPPLVQIRKRIQAIFEI
jgi:potassium-dependent mechanosensitive channel